MIKKQVNFEHCKEHAHANNMPQLVKKKTRIVGKLVLSKERAEMIKTELAEKGIKVPKKVR